MEIKFSKDRIEFEKELNALDKFVIDFTSILNELNVKYVVVSGYVPILFGRSRTSEDIDIIAEGMDFVRFGKLWREAYSEFECIITEDVKDAYNDYLLTGHSIRFSRKGRFIPNIELKFPKVELDNWTLKERKEVILKGHRIFISPLELQIPFKLFLGSDKDIEDARYLYRMFKGRLNLILLGDFNKKLKVENTFKEYIE